MVHTPHRCGTAVVAVSVCRFGTAVVAVGLGTAGIGLGIYLMQSQTLVYTALLSQEEERKTDDFVATALLAAEDAKEQMHSEEATARSRPSVAAKNREIRKKGRCFVFNQANGALLQFKRSG